MVAMARISSSLALFGGSMPWISSSIGWKAVDDRVRGGSSISTLTTDSCTHTAIFSGTLDTKTLGGAGFASQVTVTTGDNNTIWDLSAYEGLAVEVGKADGMLYTLIVKDDDKDDVQQGEKKRDDGREKASVSWEVDFRVEDENGNGSLRFPWKDFRAFYRGREREGAGEVDTRKIRRFGLMARSHFGEQEGPFRLEVKAIKAVKFSAKEDGGQDRSRGEQIQLGSL